MVERIREIYGRLPKQVAADAGYASKEHFYIYSVSVVSG
jgi:hypothetical protein